MSTARRRPSYNYGFDAGSNANHGHPDTLYPPEGYCLLERDVHRATTSLQVHVTVYYWTCWLYSSTCPVQCSYSRVRAVPNSFISTAFMGEYSLTLTICGMLGKLRVFGLSGWWDCLYCDKFQILTRDIWKVRVAKGGYPVSTDTITLVRVRSGR